MTYQVLARKWRPRDFSSLIGQEHVVRALRHALDQNRLHHAYLFTGTRGVGKTTLARILAKCLNCETGVTSQPCGTCSSCTEIDAGRFVDLLEVDAATNTKVDEMRQLLETAQYAPTRARFKVYVIDEVHMLSNSAFNAMLKTLEEPPEHLKFILATTDPQKIPVTVLSRCLQFNLKQMVPEAIVTHLSELLTKEEIAFEPDALPLIAAAANGSMRDALSLLDQAIAHGSGRIVRESVQDMLGTVDQECILSLLEAVSGDDPVALVAVAKDMELRSFSFDQALADLAGVLLRIALAQALPEESVASQHGGERVGALALALDPELTQLLYQIAVQGRSDLQLAPDPYSGFVMTLLRMHAFRPTVDSAPPSSDANARPPARRSAPAGGVTLQGQPEVRNAQSERKSAVSPAQVDGEWAGLVRSLAVTGAARELARNSELVSMTGDRIVLGVPQTKAYLADRSYQEKLKAALETRLNGRIRLDVQVGEVTGTAESVVALESRDKEHRQAQARQGVSENGFVKDLVTLFDATVIESSVREASDQTPNGS